jgi:hypothetical protein
MPIMNSNEIKNNFQFIENENLSAILVREPKSTISFIVNWESYTPFYCCEKTNHKANFPKFRILLELRSPINRKFIYSYLETEEKEYLADIEILERAQKAFGWQKGEKIDMRNYPILYTLCGCGQKTDLQKVC